VNDEGQIPELVGLRELGAHDHPVQGVVGVVRCMQVCERVSAGVCESKCRCVRE
jgi:hypothetical protein